MPAAAAEKNKENGILRVEMEKLKDDIGARADAGKKTVACVRRMTKK